MPNLIPSSLGRTSCRGSIYSIALALLSIAIIIGCASTPAPVAAPAQAPSATPVYAPAPAPVAAAVPASTGTEELDRTIKLASDDMNAELPSGSKVALLYFNSASDAFSDYVIEEMSINLVRSKKLVVVDRKEIELIRSEMEFQMSGEVSDESIQKIGKKLGAQFIISGSLISFGNGYRFRTKVINVNSAAVETSLSVVLNDSPSISHLLGQGKTSGPQTTIVKPATPSAPTTVTSPTAPAVSGSSFTDSRDGQKYRTVKIGNQTWMAENLNLDANWGKCYSDSLSNCKKYGRLYSWNMAKSICPSGWHLPSSSDWDILMKYVQNDNGLTYTSGSNASIAGKYLKATSGWNSNGNGNDKYGFAALPGGGGYSGGSFSNVGNYGDWWSASEYYSDITYYRLTDYFSGHVYWNHYDKGELRSVRCLQDVRQ